jgi:hypothetical protein
MSNNLKRNYYLVEFIANKNLPESQLKAVLATLSISQLKAIKEILVNILIGSLELTAIQIKKFSNYRLILRRLSYTSTGNKYFTVHRKLIAQIINAVLGKLKKLLE